MPTQLAIEELKRDLTSFTFTSTQISNIQKYVNAEDYAGGYAYVLNCISTTVLGVDVPNRAAGVQYCHSIGERYE